MATDSGAYIVYLHGFNSSPDSIKARQTSDFASSYYPEIAVCIPDLDREPRLAIDAVHALVLSRGRSELLGFVGSSLGGYYATYLAQYYKRSAVLINPAMRPYELLLDYLGWQTNPYTQRSFEVTQEHMLQLRQLEAPEAHRLARLYLITQLRDETLDAREGVCMLSQQKMRVYPGGNHAFEGYLSVLPGLFDFLLSNTGDSGASKH